LLKFREMRGIVEIKRPYSSSMIVICFFLSDRNVDFFN